MLREIYINNGFRHNDVTYKFGVGMTGIVGANESGKSLIAEFTRFALFGTKALRGAASEYKKLHVRLAFSVEGEEYEVERKGSKTTLARGGETVVSGTKPVDEEIRRILGYGLDVFDVANSCNQGNVEALSSMTPTARKAMVDKTIGLDQLDAMISHARTQANNLKRDAATYNQLLTEPEAPDAPTGRTDVEKIDAELKVAQALGREAAQIEGQLANVPPAPVAPEACAVTENASDLKDQILQRDRLMGSISANQRQLDRIEPEEFTEELLDEMAAQWDKADRAAQKKRLLAQGHLCCPECNHEWPIADVTGFEDVVDLEEPYPPMNLSQITLEHDKIGNNEKIEALQDAITELEKGLDDLPCRKADLAVRQAYEATLAQYEANQRAYEAYNERLPKLEARLREIGDQNQTIAILSAELTNAQVYNRQVQTYERDLALYQKRLAERDTLKAKADDFAKAQKKLTALKTSVKTFLLPSLNKVASVLLSQMTGGERSLVTVDENFEILVDGGPIHALSGSGKAVANLAIRIALGQILTNKTFSVFIGDEVDASMDDDRAAYTANALRRLTNHIQQVILITHKRPETDHMIELTK